MVAAGGGEIVSGGGGEAILAEQFDVPEDEDDEKNKIDDTSALKSAQFPPCIRGVLEASPLDSKRLESKLAPILERSLTCPFIVGGVLLWFESDWLLEKHSFTCVFLVGVTKSL